MTKPQLSLTPNARTALFDLLAKTDLVSVAAPAVSAPASAPAPKLS